MRGANSVKCFLDSDVVELPVVLNPAPAIIVPAPPNEDIVFPNDDLALKEKTLAAARVPLTLALACRLSASVAAVRFSRMMMPGGSECCERRSTFGSATGPAAQQ